MFNLILQRQGKNFQSYKNQKKQVFSNFLLQNPQPQQNWLRKGTGYFFRLFLQRGEILSFKNIKKRSKHDWGGHEQIQFIRKYDLFVPLVFQMIRIFQQNFFLVLGKTYEFYDRTEKDFQYQDQCVETTANVQRKLKTLQYINEDCKKHFQPTTILSLQIMQIIFQKKALQQKRINQQRPDQKTHKYLKMQFETTETAFKCPRSISVQIPGRLYSCAISQDQKKFIKIPQNGKR
eukprot:TRINITY_DN1972_c0_g4_i2.p2 TRINITY_DN1972_c0_g4~~TRINITY_DN1972_c0_g4_i2.p2  ORF type:complete len:234 (+),score=0.31 TRINITY_DN1972_c0_g4_i2:572-1273(+)